MLRFAQTAGEYPSAANRVSFLRWLRTQMNEVALRANDVLRNDVMLRINDVALRANSRRVPSAFCFFLPPNRLQIHLCRAIM